MLYSVSSPNLRCILFATALSICKDQSLEQQDSQQTDEELFCCISAV